MGCTQSKSATRDYNTSSSLSHSEAFRKKGSSKGKDSVDSVELSEEEILRLKEDLRLRQEIEDDMNKQLIAEKDALLAISTIMIERTTSCESLMDELEPEELDQIRTDNKSLSLQKQLRSKVIKEQKNKKKKWMLYNIVDAIDEEALVSLAIFMQNVFKALPLVKDLRKMSFSDNDMDKSGEEEENQRELLNSAQYQHQRESLVAIVPNEDIFNSDNAGFEENPQDQSIKPPALTPTHTRVFFMNPDNNDSSTDITRKRSSIAQIHDQLLTLPVYTVTSLDNYELNDDTIYDFDLSPGLVTCSVAEQVVLLYKRGGRLAPRAVRKLLRLAYKSLKELPNISHVTVTEDDRLTVVGDIHGQIGDLLHIIDASGMPSKTNKYVFNGDFVDRGPYGVEVMCTLLALHVSMPGSVFLNRGNHEDFAICTAYGFQLECNEKYGELVFGMFVAVFQQVPIFAIVNNSVIILHGGLFHATDVKIEELNEIHRTEFTLLDLPPGGEDLRPVARDRQRDFLSQLVRDALWSDPVNVEGINESARGAGVSFGPDITRQFLKNNNLNFVVRSHECVRSGYDEPFSGDDRNILCTIFSASDYGGSGNSAAYMVFQLYDDSEMLEALNTHHRMSNNITNLDDRQDSIATVGQPDPDSTSALKLVPESPDSLYTPTRQVAESGTPHKRLGYIVHYYFAAPYFEEEDEEGETTEEEGKNSSSGSGKLGLNDDHNETSADLQALENDAIHQQQLEDFKQKLHENEESKLNTESQKITKIVSSDVAANENNLINPVVIEHSKPVGFKKKEQVVVGAALTLYDLFYSRKAQLLESFKAYDVHESGVVNKSLFANVLRDTMGLHIRWINIMNLLILESHFRVHKGKKMIDYVKFLDSFVDIHPLPPLPELQYEEDDEYVTREELDRYLESVTLLVMEAERIQTEQNNRVKKAKQLRSLRKSSNFNSTDENDILNGQLSTYFDYLIPEEVVEIMYINYKQVELAFQFFDKNNDGYMTKEELKEGCLELNRVLPNESKITNYEDILQIMDIEDTGEIGFNLFFEMYRVSEMKLNVGIDEEDTLQGLTRVDSVEEEIGRLSIALSTSQISKLTHSHSQLLNIHVDNDLRNNRLRSSSADDVGLSLDI